MRSRLDALERRQAMLRQELAALDDTLAELKWGQPDSESSDPPPVMPSVASAPQPTPPPLPVVLAEIPQAAPPLVNAAPPPLPAGVTRVPLVFSGGHELNPVDHGRPVVLIAAALGVKSNLRTKAADSVAP